MVTPATRSCENFEFLKFLEAHLGSKIIIIICYNIHDDNVVFRKNPSGLLIPRVKKIIEIPRLT